MNFFWCQVDLRVVLFVSFWFLVQLPGELI